YVNGVCSGLVPEVVNCALLPAVLCGRVFLCVEFLYCVDRQNCPGSALNSFGVNNGCSVVGIVVIGPVHYKVVVFGAISIRAYREEAAAGRRWTPGRNTTRF